MTPACDYCGGSMMGRRVMEEWSFFAVLLVADIRQGAVCAAEDFFDEDSCGLRDFL
jgi:hypothetical protein